MFISFPNQLKKERRLIKKKQQWTSRVAFLEQNETFSVLIDEDRTCREKSRKRQIEAASVGRAFEGG